MAHPRKLIRQAVVALLRGTTVAGDRVQGTRVAPHKKSQLPAISVYTLSDPVDLDASAGTAPRELTHTLKLEITAWVAHSDTLPVDDAMDNIAEQIETVMDADPYLGSTAVADSILESTEMQVVEDDGHSDPIVGIVTLTYAVTYRTQPGAQTATDDFLTVDAIHQLVGGIEGDTAPAEDTFTVQEIAP